MGTWHTLYTPCGAVQAWRADPAGTPRGAVVVAHEIFGLLPHYQRLCERLADAGFIALAPAYFDLIEPGLVLPTDQAGTDRGRSVVNRLGLDCGVDATETAPHSCCRHKATKWACWGFPGAAPWPCWRIPGWACRRSAITPPAIRPIWTNPRRRH
jgi:carboxymethylenebutenolidase